VALFSNQVFGGSNLDLNLLQLTTWIGDLTHALGWFLLVMRTKSRNQNGRAKLNAVGDFAIEEALEALKPCLKWPLLTYHAGGG